MARQISLYLAIGSLLGLGVTSALLFVLTLGQGGGSWTSYPPKPDLVMRLIQATSFAERMLFPIAAFSLAVYILLLERSMRGGWNVRGFEIESTRRTSP